MISLCFLSFLQASKTRHTQWLLPKVAPRSNNGQMAATEKGVRKSPEGDGGCQQSHSPTCRSDRRAGLPHFFICLYIRKSWTLVSINASIKSYAESLAFLESGWLGTVGWKKASQAPPPQNRTVCWLAPGLPLLFSLSPTYYLLPGNLLSLYGRAKQGWNCWELQHGFLILFSQVFIFKKMEQTYHFNFTSIYRTQPIYKNNINQKGLSVSHT